GAHLGVKPSGRIEFVPRGLSIAVQPRQVCAAFMHLRLVRPRTGLVDQLLGTAQRLLDALKRLRIGAPELDVGKRKIRAYFVAPGVPRVRDRDRGLRLMLRLIQLSTPKQGLGQLGTEPAF